MSFIMESLVSFLPPFTISNILKGLGAYYLLINAKIWPLMWHARFYLSVYRNFHLRKHIMPTPEDIFAPASWTTYCPLQEMDFNFHKSNSTYFSDCDIGRTYLMAHLTKKVYLERRAAGKHDIYVAVGGVAAVFFKEIKIYTRYRVTSRLLTWDDKKWFFVVTHFHSIKPGKDGKHVLYASVCTKYCFKDVRLTIVPQDLFIEAGVLPPLPREAESVLSASGSDSGFESSEAAETALRKNFEAAVESETKNTAYWTWDRINEERERGLKIAQHMMGLDALRDEFKDGKDPKFRNVGIWEF